MHPVAAGSSSLSPSRALVSHEVCRALLKSKKKGDKIEMQKYEYEGKHESGEKINEKTYEKLRQSKMNTTLD